MKFDISLGQLREEAREAFFLAMMAGYASVARVEKRTILELPGSKMIRFEYGRYTIIDTWWTVPDSPYSFGQTIIYRDDIPVWVMQYQGDYAEDAIPFLKEALREAYSNRNFIGGRGPAKYERDGWYYENHSVRKPGSTSIMVANSFQMFSTFESIIGPGGWKGYHLCTGGFCFQRND
jgi:hypothetical protein